MATTPNLEINLTFASPLEEALDRLVDVGERAAIFADVQSEITRARDKHGVQHHLPMGTGSHGCFLYELDQAAANVEDCYGDTVYTLDGLTNYWAEAAAKELCAQGGTGDGTGGATWAKILGEEFFEAIATEDPDDLDAELVQVIAMGVSMLQAHRRQRAAK